MSANAKAAFREVLAEFYEDGLPDDIVPREVSYEESAHAATVIKGMRRSGKTYVAYQRMQALVADGVPISRIVHVNFDDDRLGEISASDLKQLPEVHAEMFPETASGKRWFFLDEIQDIPGWEKFARRLVDSRKVQLCLTGSSSKQLSEDVATEMRGRSVPVEVFPLSFREWLHFCEKVSAGPIAYDTTRQRGILRNAMAEYFETGGFPDVQRRSARVRAEMLQGYVDTVVFRDIIERHEVSSILALRGTLQHVIHNFSRKLSARAVSAALRAVGISDDRERIGEYLSWFKDAYLVHSVPLRTDSLTRRRANPDKWYLNDVGLVRVLTQKAETENGWLLENLVFLSLRRGWSTIEYALSRKGKEVDFIVTDAAERTRRLVQASWEMHRRETRERELAALREVMEETGIDNATVVTWDDEEETEDGIQIVPAWKWCLTQAV